tara:strand:- start:3448 stop:3729 length:282 start_codon:yes stop_codon:yes gene_type:complete
MYAGDLVRCRNIDGDTYGDIGVILEYKKWEKIATVHLQKSGAKKRIAARDIELLKRAPHNVERLKEEALKKSQTDILEDMSKSQVVSRINKII